MNDYLWDGTGEPDADIEQLESLLRPLGFQPPAEPFTVPALVVAEPVRRAPVYRWAIAAAVAFMALALGFWVIRSQPAESVALAAPEQGRMSDLTWAERVIEPPVPVERVESNHSVKPQRQTTAASVRSLRENQRMIEERQEGRVAADQLLKALQITSDNLNIVKTKVNQVGAATPES